MLQQLIHRINQLRIVILTTHHLSLQIIDSMDLFGQLVSILTRLDSADGSYGEENSWLEGEESDMILMIFFESCGDGGSSDVDGCQFF